MPLNLSPAFNGIPGIYVLGPSKNGVFWKVGMASSLIDRVKSYSICFPRGFYIRMLVTLPPMEPGGLWTKPNIEKAVAVIERRIHETLDEEERRFEQSQPDAVDVYRMTEVHEQSEWFHGRFADIKAVIAQTLLQLGVGARAKIHLDLAGEKYGPVERGTETGLIPEGDTVEAVDASPYLLEHMLDSDEITGVNALLELREQALDPQLQGLAIPEGPIEEREYEVRLIKGKRITKDGTVEYKVSWKGYKQENDSWEPLVNLPHALDVIDDYEKKKQDKLTRKLVKQADIDAANILVKASTQVQ